MIDMNFKKWRTPLMMVNFGHMLGMLYNLPSSFIT